MKKTEKRLDIIQELAAWSKVKGLEARIEEAAQATFAHLPASLGDATRRSGATVLLASDSAIERLNFDFRGRKKATNVLSFPQFLRREILREGKSGAPLALGDIILAYQYTAKEARDDGKLFIDHVTHLVIHGLLHLVGYDHMNEADAVKMEKMERKIMASLGLPDPYAPLEKPVKAAKKKAPKKAAIRKTKTRK